MRGLWRSSQELLASVERRRFSTGSSHPRIDVGSLLREDTDAATRSSVLASLADAMITKGYFYADNVDPLPPDYIGSVYGTLSALHSLPLQVILHTTIVTLPTV